MSKRILICVCAALLDKNPRYIEEIKPAVIWLHSKLSAEPRRFLDLRVEIEWELGLPMEMLKRAGKALMVEESVVDGRRWWRLLTPR